MSEASEKSGKGRGPQGDLDLGLVMRGMRARKWWIIAPTLGTLALTFVAVNIVKPRYTADAKILLENQDAYFTRPDKDSRDQTQALDPEAVQSQVQLISSRDLARQAAKTLDLAARPEFDPLLRGADPISSVLVLLGLQKDSASTTPEERVLESYFNKLTVFSVAKTRVLSVEFVSNDPELAARAANTVADLYLAADSDAKKANVRSAATWLLPAIQELRAKVQQAEAQTAEFRARSNLLLGTNNTTISNQQLADLNTQLATARAAKAEAQARGERVGELLRKGRVFEISDVVKDDLIRRVSEQRVTLKAQLALEARTLLPGHPRMKELQAQLSDVEGEMRRAGEKVARSLEGDAKVAAARVHSIEATLEAQKKVTATGDGEDVQLRAYEREAKSSRDQLESYLQKYREATVREGANATPADARIISRAFAPQLPSFPKKLPTLLIAGLGALMLSGGLVLARLLLSATSTPAIGNNESSRERKWRATMRVARAARQDRENDAKRPSTVGIDAGVGSSQTDAMRREAESGPAAASAWRGAAARGEGAHVAATDAPLMLRDVAIGNDGAAPRSRSAAEPEAGADSATPASALPPPSRLAGLVRVVRELRANEAKTNLGLCVLVTGLRRANGATSTAIALARTLARDARAVLVDLDLATPGLDALVPETGSAEAPIGVSDLLSGAADIEDVLHRDEGSALHVAPAGGADHDEAALHSGIAGLVAVLRRTYDFVILDAAAPSAQPQTLRLAELARAVVVVAPHPHDNSDEIVALLRQLPSNANCESLIYTPPALPGREEKAA